MAIEKPGKRSKKKVETENYYKILELRTNATQEMIKKSYIERVREFPPETHPEQFQQVRKAYETLRDPRKRGEYDLLRKYGGKLEKMLDKAAELSGEGEWGKAAVHYEQILSLDARSIPALLGIGHAALHTKTNQTIDEYFERALECSDSGESKLQILITQARLFYQHDMPSETLEALNRIKISYPEETPYLVRIYCDVYLELGRNEEAWALIYSHIPQDDGLESIEFGIFIDWINMMIRLNKWNVLSKVQQRVRKFLKSLIEEEERQAAFYELMEEYEEYWEYGRFREALIFVELAYYLNPREIDIKEELRETQKLVIIEKEIDRMMRDGDMFPLVTMHAIEWFFEDHLSDNALYSFRNSIPSSIMEELDNDNESLAAGISRLKKKFPQLYRQFQSQWNDMYAQSVAGMNREQRRRIR